MLAPMVWERGVKRKVNITCHILRCITYAKPTRCGCTPQRVGSFRLYMYNVQYVSCVNQQQDSLQNIADAYFNVETATRNVLQAYTYTYIYIYIHIQRERCRDMCIYVYIYTERDMYMSLSLYIYIYIERERDRQIAMYMCRCIYIYICIHTHTFRCTAAT